MYHLSFVVAKDIYIPLHGPHRLPWKGTPRSFKKLQAALCQGFRDDQSRTLEDLFLHVDLIALSSLEELDDCQRSLRSTQGMGNTKIMNLQ